MKNKEQWQGYTMRELQMHRAINAVKLEVAKEKALAHVDSIKEGAVGNITSYLFSNLGNISRTIGMATAIIGIGRKIYSLVRRK